MRRVSVKLAIGSLLLVTLGVLGRVYPGAAVEPDGVAAVALGGLPVQGNETYLLIRRGGPFAFEKDGVVFANREKLLPLRQRGYYREYTVRMPASRDRGIRRMVCGGPPTTPDVCYYSADHYASFRRVVP